MNMNELLQMQKELMDHVPHGHVIKPDHQGLVVAACGIIEETIEFLNSIGFKSWRPNPLPREDQLEEATDILFFYLELLILGGFSWQDIMKEYKRKWRVNMDRYESAKQNNYDWDLRGKKEGL
jgi:phosphoribosyl-ATP pyrophosphohydrolase